MGAGTKNTPDRPYVVRVALGAPVATGPQEDPEAADVVLEANVDDLDPRLWPGVLASLLSDGASDGWLVPILTKKGRPAHTLQVLAPPGRVAALRERVFRETGTIGVRESAVGKTVLERTWVRVAVLDRETVPIKVAHRQGTIVRATPEFEDVAALAAAHGLPVITLLDAANAAAVANGHPHPRLRRRAVVLRRAAQRGSADGPDPGAAGLLRSARPSPDGPGRELPHPVGRRPYRRVNRVRRRVPGRIPAVPGRVRLLCVHPSALTAGARPAAGRPRARPPGGHRPLNAGRRWSPVPAVSWGQGSTGFRGGCAIATSPRPWARLRARWRRNPRLPRRNAGAVRRSCRRRSGPRPERRRYRR